MKTLELNTAYMWGCLVLGVAITKITWATWKAFINGINYSPLLVHFFLATKYLVKNPKYATLCTLTKL